MDKSKLPALIGIFLVIWAVLFLASYLILKSTTKWDQSELVDTTQVKEGDDLKLTWDISGEATPPDEKLKQLEEQHLRHQQEAKALVDSAVSAKTKPLADKVQKTEQELSQAKSDVAELEDLLTALASRADSLDQVKAAKLSKILEGMKPQKAASILSRLDSNVNAELLLKMRQKSAAKILAELPQTRAAEIAKFLSEAYARSSI